ncbi:hypothetical protein AMECASPLE_023988 [Ameca splendens]|uniref:Uncharacterized protein n=1 Tax=Ameca splendens TaxID=208324 RepID=A0ABV0XH95_9TELE
MVRRLQFCALKYLSSLLPWLRQKLLHKAQNCNFFLWFYACYFNVPMSYSNVNIGTAHYTDAGGGASAVSGNWYRTEWSGAAPPKRDALKQTDAWPKPLC